jgi:hypothetical protein
MAAAQEQRCQGARLAQGSSKLLMAAAATAERGDHSRSREKERERGDKRFYDSTILA